MIDVVYSNITSVFSVVMRLAREFCIIILGVTFLYFVINTYNRGVGQIRLEGHQLAEYDDITEDTEDHETVGQSGEDTRDLTPDLYPGAATQSDRILEQLAYLPPANLTSEPLTILIWQGLAAWGGIKPREGREVFDRESCPVRNCLLTGDQTQLESSDLVIFRERVPQMKKKGEELWMIYNLESPLNSHISGEQCDWTATYRRDSTIVAPYGAWRRHRAGQTEASQAMVNFAENKTGLVAWLVSNCNTRNGRLEYAQQLATHIRLDIYGRCGTEQCQKNSQQCRDQLRQYKFYLSFENSNCADYITEKFWENALHNNILPIVMGPSIQDYEAVAPPKSFIHVKSFASPADLARYLHVLDQDDDLYNEYFAWKQMGDFIATKFFCRVCSMLHYSRHFSQEVRDVNTWWSGPGVCSNT